VVAGRAWGSRGGHGGRGEDRDRDRGRDETEFEGRAFCRNWISHVGAGGGDRPFRCQRASCAFPPCNGEPAGGAATEY
jgi:hypothetical protein